MFLGFFDRTYYMGNKGWLTMSLSPTFFFFLIFCLMFFRK